MTLSDEGLGTGTRIGPYEILSPLGAGGMGRVYLALDTKLDRQVAIKAIPQEFASDADRLARFQREARVLATLNHPNIAGIYGLEEKDGATYLVLEFVPGQSMADRLARGPMTIEESLEACKHVASALEATHEAGVIHRDLKPGNVMVSEYGLVKVLDFGLAKVDVARRASDPDQAHTPTASMGSTSPGMVMGTAAYMSPEQARGRALDRRTDIWSLGCVLFECLTGRQAFRGESLSDVIAGILEREPDWALLPQRTPARVRDLLKECLEKDDRRRMRDAGDVRLELEKALSEKEWSSSAPQRPDYRTPSRSLRRLLPWVATGAAVIVVALAFWLGTKVVPPRPGAPAHLELRLPTSAPLQTVAWQQLNVAISPDGSTVVYSGVRGWGCQLFRRNIGDTQVSAIPGSEGGMAPFFSPDGRSLGFLAGDGSRLMRIPLEGGNPVLLADNCFGESGSWLEEGVYFTAKRPLMGHAAGSLFRVAGDGGAPQFVLAPDETREERYIFCIQRLPGAGALLLGVGKSDGNYSVECLPPKGGRRTKVLDAVILGGVYVPTGHILYMGRGSLSLLAVPFDAGSLKATGAPVALEEEVTGFAISDSGTLVWLPRSNLYGAQSYLSLVDRVGNARPLTGDADFLLQPRVSPDGRCVAVERYSEKKERIWVLDLERNTFGLLTTGSPDPSSRSLHELAPAWFPSGREIALCSQVFRSRVDVLEGIYAVPFGSGGAYRQLAKGLALPESFSPDGRFLTFGRPWESEEQASAKEIWVLPMEGKGEPKTLIASKAFIARGSRVSPDGRWMAYFSNESGRFEVYVQAFPGLGQKVQASNGGGIHPLWSPDGRELFYLSGESVMAVPIRFTPAFQAGVPKPLFTLRFQQAIEEPPWDITPDGQHFVMIQQDESTLPTQINVVLNFFEELKRKAPRGK